jgi:hypothetical protein
VNVTFAIIGTSMPCAESSTICARRQVTTDPRLRRTVRITLLPSGQPAEALTRDPGRRVAKRPEVGRPRVRWALRLNASGTRSCGRTRARRLPRRSGPRRSRHRPPGVAVPRAPCGAGVGPEQEREPGMGDPRRGPGPWGEALRHGGTTGRTPPPERGRGGNKTFKSNTEPSVKLWTDRISRGTLASAHMRHAQRRGMGPPAEVVP